MGSIYTSEGWLDVPAILRMGYPFTFITGGRGTGKTFGALRHARERSSPGHRFMLLRRTQVQLELIGKQEFSPFKAVDAATGTMTCSTPLSKNTVGFYNGQETDDGRLVPSGQLLGYGAALSVFSNLRGFGGGEECDLVIFDEFIPQAQERPIKDEAGALWNCMETLGRNRELAGKDPMQLLCLANANTLGNPIFLDLGLVTTAERMRAVGREIWTDDKRGILLVILQQSPISEAKRETALYKLQQGSDFAKMALDNDFSYEERSIIGRADLKELVPVAAIGEICIYRRKSGGYYISGHRSGSPDSYGTGPGERARFKRKYLWLWQAYMQRKIMFEQYVDEVLFNKYMT